MILTWLRTVDARLGRMSRDAILGIALIIAILIGVADYYTSPDLLVLYLAPLFLAGWYGGARPGYVVAIYASAASFVTLTFVNGSHEFNGTAAANLFVRLAAYLAIAHVFVRLRDSRRQQEDLIGFIIHDLRSPIASSITGLTTLEQSSDHLSETDKEMVQLALVSNQRALTLVNSILDVAKMESGKMSVNWANVELEPFIDECLTHLALWAQSHQISFEKDLQPSHAELDPDLTTRVLANLLSNALKFSPEKSTIKVTTRPFHGGVRFAIDDEGPGIPSDQAEKIFEPFSQVEGTQGGTGLGLTFCRLAVHAQNGKIGVKSQLGKGTTFWFTIGAHGHSEHQGDAMVDPQTN